MLKGRSLGKVEGHCRSQAVMMNLLANFLPAPRLLATAILSSQPARGEGGGELDNHTSGFHTFF